MNLSRITSKQKLFWVGIYAILCIMPFWFLYNQIFEFRVNLYILSKLDRILLLLISIGLATKINWNVAYKTHTLIINATFIAVVTGFVNSFLFNSGYLFNFGLLNELIPLVALSTFFVFKSQHKFGTSKKIPLVIIALALINQILIIAKLNFNLYFINLDANYLGIFGFCLAGMLMHYIPNIESKVIRILSNSLLILTCGLTIFYSSTLAWVSILVSVLITIKMRKDGFNVIKPMVLGLCIITILSGLSSSLYTTNLSASLLETSKVLIQNSKRLFFGYGVGSIGEKSGFVFGDNYDKFINRPIISESGSQDKTFIIDNPSWVYRLVVNGGFIYMFAYMTVLLIVLLSYRRDDWIFGPLLLVYLFSIIFNPLSYIPIYIILILTPLLIEYKKSY
jgi:hypothetical protein